MQSVPEPIRPAPCLSVSYHLNASPVLSIPKHRTAIAAQFSTILFQRDSLLCRYNSIPFLCYHFKPVIRKPPLRLCCSAHFQSTSTPFTSSSSHRSRCQRLSFHPQQCQFISFHSGSAASAVPFSAFPLQINSTLAFACATPFHAMPRPCQSQLCQRHSMPCYL